MLAVPQELPPRTPAPELLKPQKSPKCWAEAKGRKRTPTLPPMVSAGKGHPGPCTPTGAAPSQDMCPGGRGEAGRAGPGS